MSVGTAAAMRPGDVLLPSFREHGAQLWRGVSLKELFLYWAATNAATISRDRARIFRIASGRFARPARRRRGLGVSLARRKTGRRLRVRRRRNLKGRCRRGSQHRGRVEGARRLCGQQQRLGDLVPVAKQTAAATLAQKAIAAGIPGEQVDGNDVIAVRAVVALAIERADRGDGPTLIEALTYRLSDHTTADDASRYRNDSEVSPHWHAEPVARLRNHMTRTGLWDKSKEDALLRECSAAVEQATDDYLAMPPQPAETTFDQTYAQLPADLIEQRKAVTRTQGAP